MSAESPQHEFNLLLIRRNGEHQVRRSQSLTKTGTKVALLPSHVRHAYSHLSFNPSLTIA